MFPIPESYQNYVGKLTKQDDFASFWQEEIDAVHNHQLKVSITAKKTQLFDHIEVNDLVFNALDQTDICGIYLKNTQKPSKRCILTTHGYRSKTALPHQYLHWLAIGFDVIAFDVRLQGGKTGSNTTFTGPVYELFTSNILDFKQSYLMLIHRDMFVASLLPQYLGYEGYVLEGTSQAAGLSIACAAFLNTADYLMVNVPSFADLDERIMSKASGSFKAFQKVGEKDPAILAQVLKNISYIDNKNFADLIQIPIFASVGGEDQVCPAKCFFATYNRITSPKEIIYYPFNAHEGGGADHTQRELEALVNFYK